MAARKSEFAALGAKVAVVGPGTMEEARALSQRLRIDIPVLGDPDGRALDALGLTRVLGPLRSSGSVVIDREGIVRYALRTANPMGALRMADVLGALQA